MDFKETNMHYALLLLICLIGQTTVFAQNKPNDALAIQYYQNEEYDKAYPIFKALFEENPSSFYYYEYYFNTLLQLEDYSTAEKMLKKQSRKYEPAYVYEIDLAYVYEKQEEDKKAKKIHKQLLKDLPEKQSSIQQMANALDNRGRTDLAMETYLEGRKKLNDEFAFVHSLTDIYLRENKIEEFFKEYLRWFEADVSRYDRIRDEVQEVISGTAHYELFKEMLLDRIQKKPDQRKLVDLLSWTFEQQKEFRAAFIQLRALDKRMNEGGLRLLTLAKSCINNEAFDVAADIYAYIMELGEDQPYYHKAYQGNLEVRYQMLKRSSDKDSAEVVALKNDYEQIVKNNVFKYDNSGQLILRLAELKANYLDNVASAIYLLESFLEKQRMPKNVEAEIKIALGDYYILKDDVWEAALYYGQVEKMFKDHPLGHKAKFRNAKLAFYRGEFNWAKAQLDVLKASTSELIANDALELSLLIKENTGLDDDEQPLQLFSQAELYIFTKNYDKAKYALNELQTAYPSHSLIDNVYMAKAKIHYQQSNYEKAAEYYQKIYNEYGYETLADKALFQLGDLYLNKLKDEAKAMDYFEKILLEYKGSIFTIPARKRLRELRGA